MIQALNLRAAEIAMEMQTLEELEKDGLGAVKAYHLTSTCDEAGTCSWVLLKQCPFLRPCDSPETVGIPQGSRNCSASEQAP